MVSAKELKQKYLAFFQSKGHAVIPSASLVPENDPTVLFTTAGMHPLVPFLMGQPHPLGKRLTDVQKCVRTGDIDDVGDATHLTFFEMLGNWSLGDYFKKESISWSFEFLTSKEWLNIPLNRLAFTCFEGNADAPKDEESQKIWLGLGVPSERIAFLPKEDNWWGPAGQTGPCGPDTEIFYWKDNSNPAPVKFDPKNKNWVEIWNNVFMQYDKQADGTLAPLKQKCVDTGMGVERTALVLQGKENVYETELFQPILKKIETITGKKYEEYQKEFRIIADHIRTATFMLGDERSVTPSNTDRGYILRRLIRRSVRNIQKLNPTQKNACQELAEVIISQYQLEYPLLAEKKQIVFDELTKEEQKFNATLEKGLSSIRKKIVGEVIKLVGIQALKDSGLMGKDVEIVSRLSQFGLTQIDLDAKWVFDQFQSHGMPTELTIEEIANYNIKIPNESQIKSDIQKLFLEHQEKSRAGAEAKFKGGLADESERVVRLHTATHLLNEALRKVVDKNIVQKGSNITAERLRFDFNFERKLTPEEITAVEAEVNRVINLALPVTIVEMSPDEAKANGAQSEFGQKYPPKVTVYKMGDYSMEICMGPHVTNTKDVGVFKIQKEESSAAGIRRIKATVE